jgi:hypothetical protein
MSGRPIDPIAIDVRAVLNDIGEEVHADLMQQSVSLHSYLVTRPTGRAVRMAIETQLPGAGSLSLSVIDFSEVTVIDFSCADEVVAKLLQQYLASEPPDAFFIFRGVHEEQRDQILAVLTRQGLAAVVEREPGHFHLMGELSADEERVWGRLEEHGNVDAEQIETVFDGHDDRATLTSLFTRGLAFRSPKSGRVHALSRLVQHLL